MAKLLAQFAPRIHIPGKFCNDRKADVIDNTRKYTLKTDIAECTIFAREHYGKNLSGDGIYLKNSQNCEKIKSVGLSFFASR